MTKALTAAFFTIFCLPACTQEAEVPVQDEVTPDNLLPDDTVTTDTMPDGIVQEENGTAAPLGDDVSGEEDAKILMEPPETEETDPTQ